MGGGGVDACVGLGTKCTLFVHFGGSSNHFGMFELEDLILVNIL